MSQSPNSVLSTYTSALLTLPCLTAPYTSATMPPGFFPRSTALSNVREFIGRSQGLVCEPLLPLIAEQAAKADSTRSVDPPVIQAIKQTDLMRLSATRNIGGVEASISSIINRRAKLSNFTNTPLR